MLKCAGKGGSRQATPPHFEYFLLKQLQPTHSISEVGKSFQELFPKLCPHLLNPSRDGGSVRGAQHPLQTALESPNNSYMVLKWSGIMGIGKKQVHHSLTLFHKTQESFTFKSLYTGLENPPRAEISPEPPLEQLGAVPLTPYEAQHLWEGFQSKKAPPELTW